MIAGLQHGGSLFREEVFGPVAPVVPFRSFDEGLEEFQQTKHVHWDIAATPKPWWFPLQKA